MCNGVVVAISMCVCMCMYLTNFERDKCGCVASDAEEIGAAHHARNVCMHMHVCV